VSLRFFVRLNVTRMSSACTSTSMSRLTRRNRVATNDEMSRACFGSRA
jgi:hypothetical protein